MASSMSCWAGRPCQGFSVNSHIRNGDDPRNSLFRHYVRILKGLAPKVFVLENVPGMFSLEGGRFFDELLAEIGALNSLEYGGYETRFKILNAAHYGVPQERFRLVLIGTRRDIADEVGTVEVPEPVHYSLAQAHFKGGRTHTFHYAIGHRDVSPQYLCWLFSLLPPISVKEAIGDLPPLVNGGGVDEAIPYSRSRQLSDFQKRMRLVQRPLQTIGRERSCRPTPSESSTSPKEGTGAPSLMNFCPRACKGRCVRTTPLATGGYREIN